MLQSTDVAREKRVMPQITAPRAPVAETRESAGTEKQPCIVTKNLTAFFGDTPAVKDVSVAIPQLAVTAIIGPSGCGKSTILRCLNRMH